MTNQPQQSEPQHFLDYWRVIASRKEVVIAVSLLVVITGILVTYSMPKVYKSSAVVQVKEESPDMKVFSPEVARFDPLFLRTQFQIIQSVPVIEDVVRTLNLAEKFAVAYGYQGRYSPEESFRHAVSLLGKRIKVQQYRDTNLIEIEVYLSEPKDVAPAMAAEIANMVAEVFRDQNLRRSRTVTERALKVLRSSLEEQKKRMKDAEDKVTDVREKHGIVEVNQYLPSGVGGTLEKETVRMLEAQRVRVCLELEQKKARREKVNSLSAENLLAAAPWLAGDPAMAELVRSKTEAEIRLKELLRASLGANHPDVQKAQGIIDGFQKKIDEALVGLRTGLDADYEAAQAMYKAVEDMLLQAKVDVMDETGKGVREMEEALAELEHARKIHDALEMRVLQEDIEQRIPRTAVDLIQPAQSADPSNPVSPDFLLNIILSIVVGVGCGVGLAYFIEYLDTSVKTIEDIERYLSLTVMGVIPQKVKPLHQEDAEQAHAEAYRVLRTNLQSSNKIRKGSALCITSGSVGEGKSLTIFNLAYTCATLGDRVLLVDSDLHRPRQHKILGVSNRSGLANVLVGDTTVDEALIHTPHTNLDFLPSGKLSSGVHGLLDTERMRDLIRELKGRYDFVFFDAPPIVGVSDASLLAREMDGVLLVIQHRKYPRALSGRAKAMLDNIGANLMGVVLNNINIARDYSSYYYQQHYYAYPRRERNKETAKPAKPAKTA